MRHQNRFRIRFLGMLLLLGGMLAFQGMGWCDLDTIYLANGQVVQGKVRQITGEYIEYRTTTGATALLKRIQLASRRDMIVTNLDRKYLGEIIHLGHFIAEMDSSTGFRSTWKVFNKKIILGIPTHYNKDFIESDAQLQAPPKMFPAR